MTVTSCGSTGLASAERLAVAPPDSADLSTTSGETDSITGTARMLAEILADVMHVEHVSVDSHFFEDLSADSLVMAHFCARVRKRADLPTVSIKDTYEHPTIRRLAVALAPPPVHQRPLVQMRLPAHAQDKALRPVVARRASTAEYVLCGTLQFLLFLGLAFATAAAGAAGYEWITGATGLIDTYLRSVCFGAACFLGVFALPILAKWLLVGRWKAQEIRIWSVAYLRFWIVKTLVQKNPVALLIVGTPLYVVYLRALGAKVGSGVAIFSRNVPVCTDLLSIGAGTVIRKDSFFTCYRAHAGLIQTGAVSLGTEVFVGEATVLDVWTSLGDGAQVGHSSALHAGQAVPAGERWHGSPALRTHADYRGVGDIDCGAARRAIYTAAQLANLLLLYVPLAVGAVDVLLAQITQFASLRGALAFTSWTFYRDALAVSFVLFFGSVLVGLLVVVTVPRMLSLAIRPGKVYRLYGFHYAIHRAITRLTNIKFFTYLFGDSSFVVHYLRGLGYHLSPVQQTGSNFGLEVKHETPYLSFVGTGTVVADGLSIVNADVSSTSFRLSPTSIGRRNFLGNNVTYPSQGRTGDNCLLATKVLVPVDGVVRQNVGLLGSPSFEIPRSVLRDSRFDRLKIGDELRRRLASKNKYNTVTMGLYLLVRWMHLFAVTVLAWAAADLYASLGVAAIALAYVLILAFSVGYFALIERAATGFRALTPQFCSIYEPYFWWHERYWKVPAAASLLQIFNGTPVKGAIWRLLGVRVGRRLFDDGCTISEKTMVTIGDVVTLNANTIIQCHSQEDDTFKSDYITIGSDCTLGIGVFVLYGAAVGDGAALAADSFLMKGEEVPRGARWGGNPAGDMRGDRRGATTTFAAMTTVAPAPERQVTYMRDRVRNGGTTR
jgi:non-ribosomal peptide synthetase-like protein